MKLLVIGIGAGAPGARRRGRARDQQYPGVAAKHGIALDRSAPLYTLRPLAGSRRGSATRSDDGG